MTLQDKLNIIQNEFHLNIKEVEPLVYKVLNTDQEVNSSKLKWTLEEVILIKSLRIRLEKVNYTGMSINNIYYIILDYTRDDLKDKYHKIARTEHKKAIIDLYNSLLEESQPESIDTIYRAEELTV